MREIITMVSDMRIGDVVKLTGLCANTLRRYEARGYVTPKRDWAGVRRYTSEDIEAIRAHVNYRV
jgi:DNA-binding transcriptional MerR regulator